MTRLHQALELAARAPVLLVGCDYDGTIAPIVADPKQARPQREVVVALQRLAALPQTSVAVVSGRALADLAALTRLPEVVHLVGSHGGEFDLGFVESLSAPTAALRERVRAELEQLAAATDGALVETKPASVAFHYRNVKGADVDALVRRIVEGPGALEGVFVRRGKMVVELGVVATDKGAALESLRARFGAGTVVYFGDDETDEDAFRTLRGPDVAVKVGAGTTVAAHRVQDPQEVARCLAALCERREEWLAGRAAVPIERHSLLSDQRAMALVTPAGRIAWYCAPRVDSPPLFADLLGGVTAGHFTIGPSFPSGSSNGECLAQEYDGDSMVLVTRWDGFTVTDFLDCSGGRPTRRAGRSDLVRIVAGAGSVAVRFAPRIDFGRVPTRLRAVVDGIVVENAPDPVVLRCPGANWTLDEEGIHQTASAKLELDGGERVLELRYGTASLREADVPAAERRDVTGASWAAWVRGLRLPPIESALVSRSALVLKALCHGPTGAICAATTTSLPECIGGVRNWDYRYCWLRDAAMAAAALVKLGSNAEAMHYLDWVCDVVERADAPERLRPLYTVSGRHVGPEASIDEMPGYRASRPVRVGNAAATQVQLDVFGAIADLIALLAERDAPLSADHFRLVEEIVRAVGRRWHEPDHGIWEIRTRPRHHVHSKVLCWQAVDRALRVARRFLDREPAGWTELRDAIAADVLENGFKSDVGAFTAAYDGSDLDAAALVTGLSGLLPADDERFTGTVRAVEEHLLEGPAVYRYRAEDGLPGFEGGFLLCTSWLVEAYLLTGRQSDAERLFHQFAALAGPTGSLAEEYDPRSGTSLGNVPQAYSHAGIIENALRLTSAG